MRKHVRLLCTIVLLIGLSLVSTQPARAAATVTTCDEPSLRTALAAGGTIAFTCSGTITLTAALAADTVSDIIITVNTVLDASGQNVTIVGSGQSPNPPRADLYRRIFYVNPGVSLGLTNLNITGGDTSTSGGLVWAHGGNVTIANSTLSGHSADINGGVIFQRTVLTDVPALVVTGSTFAGNSATGTGSQGKGGAIFALAGTVDITNSTFHDNSANSGGDSIFANSGVTSNVINSTFVSDPMMNSASAANFTLTNNIFSNSPCGNAYADGGGNVLFNSACSGITPISTEDPRFDTLAGNAAASQPPYYPLKRGSLAIDTLACGPADDQLGNSRPVGWRCDAGAFEFQTKIDYGDAPTAAQSGFTSDYPTFVPVGEGTAAASHLIDTLFLGSAVDSDANGMPSSSADGDDTTGATPDDEDGVVFPTPANLTAGSSRAPVNVTASLAGNLDAWIDFNQDGDWLDAGEQIFTSHALVAGVNNLTFAIPAGANIESVTFARFRVSSIGGLAPDTAFVTGGEVEDHPVTIMPPAPDSGFELLLYVPVLAVPKISGGGQ